MNLTPNDDIELPLYLLYKGYDAPPTIERVAWLGEGDFCFCYLVNGEYVLRFAKHATASAAIVREACVLSVIAPLLSVAVPQIEASGLNAETGEQMQAYPLVPGTILESEVLEELPPEVQSQLIAQMATFMRQLHAIPLDALAGCGLPMLNPAAWMERLLTDGRERLKPILAPEVWDYYESMATHYRANEPLYAYTPVLLHGDFSPDHVLADINTVTVTGIIDFGDAMLGAPARDFIYILEDYGEALFEEFLAHYDSDHAVVLAHATRFYQAFNNIEYALSVLEGDDADDLAEALELLAAQAGVPGG